MTMGLSKLSFAGGAASAVITGNAASIAIAAAAARRCNYLLFVINRCEDVDRIR
jgi:hypothetical protein